MTLPRKPLSRDLLLDAPTWFAEANRIQAIPRFFWLAFAVLLGSLWMLATTVLGDESSPSIDSIDLGIGRYWKVGYATRTRIAISHLPLNRQVTVEMETVDADGISITYSGTVESSGSRTAVTEFISRHGRSNRPIKAIVRDNTGIILAQRDLSEVERGTVLPMGHSWIVGVGKQLNVEQAAMRSTKSSLLSYSVSNLEEASQAPSTEQGYQGVSLIVLSTTDIPLLKAFTSSQQTAIKDWVLRGGNLLVWTGESSTELKSLPWLASLIGEERLGIETDVEPGTLESFLSSQNKLPSLNCASFQVQRSSIELTLTTKDRRRLPVLFHRAVGLGRVQVFACDANKNPIADWPDRSELLAKLLAYHGIEVNRPASMTQVASDIFGIDDLASQLRSTLENFQSVRPAGLVIVVCVVAVFLLLAVGVDYFVIVKAWRKPRWTWGTLLIWSALAVMSITMLKYRWKPTGNFLNCVEIFDIDEESGFQRGRAWGHLYAGVSSSFDLEATARSLLNRENKEEELPSFPVHCSWGGHPGKSMGGFESSIRTDYGFPGYRSKSQFKSSNSPSEFSSMEGVGIATGGTKSFEIEWTLPSTTETLGSNKFTASRSNDQLEGSWINPMSEDLLDGFLVYRRWMYRLPSKFRAGAMIQITARDIPKDLSRYLQQRQIVKDSDVGIPWNPQARDNLLPLVEMIMLHESAGGSAYTGLKNEYLADLDSSKLLNDNRILVIGRLDRSIVDWSISACDHEVDVQNDRRATFVRFLIPVTQTK
jgi:hypothetical protein